MEIYHEPAISATPGRKLVSFAPEGGRTPLLTRAGRKPLAAHNHSNNNSISSRHGTPFSKDTNKRGAAVEDYKAPLSTKSSQDDGGENPTPVSRFQLPSQNKENQSTLSFLLSPTAMAIVPSASPTSAQSFRRALKGKSPKETDITVGEQQPPQLLAQAPAATKVVSFGERAGLLSKRPGPGRGLLAGGAGALGPPQRVAPQTPKSLLRTEMMIEDDGSTSELEESLLVSPPPGALWNVLGVGSATSSTGLVIVSPQTAATIHEIMTSEKKKKQQKHQQHSTAWSSPPFQPRSLLQTTPEGDENEAGVSLLAARSPEEEGERVEKVVEVVVEEEKHTIAVEEVIKVESPEATIQASRKGVAMDLSNMFSEEKKKLQVATVQGSSQSFTPVPPPHLLERLRTTTSRRTAAQNPQTEIQILNMAKHHSPKEVTNPLPSAQEVVVDVACVKATERGRGVSMDVSQLFFLSKTTEATPPPRLLERLQKQTASSMSVPKEETVKAPKVARKTNGTTESVQEVLPESRGNGFSLDMSKLFSDTTSAASRKVDSTPPPHLLERLQQRTALKANKASGGAEKENTTVQSKNRVAKGQKLPKTQPTNSSATLQKGIARLSRPPITKPAKTKMGTLQRNVGFCPKQEAPTEKGSKAHVKTPKADTVSSVIEAPKEKVFVQKPTSRKAKTFSNAKSPIKIVREANDWAGKQCDTFVSWLNYTFQPDEDDDDEGGEILTSGRSGLRALVMHRRLAQVRFRAAELFQSDSMRRVRTIVQSEISRGRLTIRSDRDLYADLSLRQLATELLLSYTTPWLRLGLEVMFGECIMPEKMFLNQSDCSVTPVARLRATLRAFVVERVLSDTSVLMKYTRGKTNVPSGKFEKLFREEMRTLVLYRLMVLILFLDHAKTENVLDKVPRLFTKSSEVKSSKAVLQLFCRNFLSSEGDFIKHLSRIGLEVSYVQDPIDELEFNVTNLATDLRDGGRLTRMTEIITKLPFKSMMRSLRLPAVSRLQKMHNVNVAISKLKGSGIWIPDDVNAHHVVDAHREMVLKLMWSVIAHACMTKLLSEGQVEHEIQSVLRSRQARRNIEGLKSRSLNLLTCDQPAVSTQESPEEVLKSLLFRWSNAVCSSFGLRLQDFSESFSDGKALCYLVHYYHPTVIRLDEILPTTNDEDAGLSLEQALLNERSNSAMVAKRVTELGGIPNMLPVTDSHNPPDEKGMLLCLTYLCSRLMESSEEIFATILIQACYRRYLDKILHQKKEAAALEIFQFWCDHKLNYYAALHRRYASAVAVLEDFVITHKRGLLRLKRHRLERETRHAAAIEIQRHYRGQRGREYFFSVWEREHAAVVIQQYYRRYNAELYLLEAMLDRNAAIKIQACWRGAMVRQLFQRKVFAAIKFQKIAKGFLVRRSLQCQHHAAMVIQQAWWSWVDYADSQNAAILIQSRCRGIFARKLCRDLVLRHQAAAVLQKIWRGYIQSIVFAITREITISIQRVFRGYLIRKVLPVQKMSRAATMLQKTWRGFAAQVQYNLDVMDLVTVQSLVRARVARKITMSRKVAIARLQRAIRCALSRRSLMRLRVDQEHKRLQHKAAIVCQCMIRNWQAKKEMLFRVTLNSAARVIQCTWRGFVSRSDFTEKVLSITVIQAYVRAWQAMDWYRKNRCAAVTLQAYWRRYSAMLNFKLDVLEIVIAQSVVRRRFSQIVAGKRRQSVQMIQNLVRRWHALKRLEHRRCQYNAFLAQQASAICLQSVARTFLAKLSLGRRRHAATLIEASFRMSISRNRFLAIKFAATKTQALFRGMIIRQELWWKHSLATLIQAIYRGRIARVLFELERYDVTVVQSLVRRWLACRQVIRRVNSIVAIQCIVRMWIARGTLDLLCLEKKTEIAENAAATVLQRSYRGYLVRRNFAVLHAMATCVQTSFRRHYWSFWYQMNLVDIVITQSQVRRWSKRRWFQKTTNSTVVLQAAARRLLATRQVEMMRAEKIALDNQNLACLNIQRLWRGHTSRKVSSQHAAARKIQKTWRCFVAHVDYLVQQIAVIRIQTHFRKFYAQNVYFRAKRSLVKFQAVTRGVLERKYLRVLATAATMIQSYFRAHLGRIAFSRMRHSATLIQGVARGYILREEMKVSNFAASEIQRIWRGFVQFCDYFVMFSSAIKLQTVIRRTIAIRKYEELKLSVYADRCFFEKKARTVQRAFRTYSHQRHLARAAMRIQNLGRRFIYRRRASRLDRGMRRLQAVYRAKIIRRRRSKRVTAVVTRLDRANMKARRDPKLQIGYKTRYALKILQNSKSLAEIMDAVKSLETSTRLSPLCCVLFTEADAARILLDLIRSCNRSVPHVELVHCILLTLDNVSQYRMLVPSFATCYSAEIFLDKMQMFRDKDGIFCLSVNLLSAIANSNPMVQDYCALHEHLKRLKALHQLSLRRAQPSRAATERDANKKPNRMKRRETFDRNGAIKALGLMVEKFEEVALMPVESAGTHHFTF